MNHIMKAKWVLNSISCWFYIIFLDVSVFMNVCFSHRPTQLFLWDIYLITHLVLGPAKQQFQLNRPTALAFFSKCLLMLHLWVDIWIYGHSSDWPLITVTVLFNSLTVNKRSNSGDARLFNWLSHPPSSGIEQRVMLVVKIGPIWCSASSLGTADHLSNRSLTTFYND